MVTTTRAQLLKELVPGLNALFGLEMKRYPDEHAEIYDIETSERAFEEEAIPLFISSLPKRYLAL